MAYLVRCSSIRGTDRRSDTVGSDSSMTALQCMSFLKNSSKILVAGYQSVMYVIDVEKGTIMKMVGNSFKDEYVS